MSRPYKTFDQWCNEVDQQCYVLAGCSIYDLPDVPLYDWYDDGNGMTARAAAKKAITLAAL